MRESSLLGFCVELEGPEQDGDVWDSVRSSRQLPAASLQEEQHLPGEDRRGAAVCSREDADLSSGTVANVLHVSFPVRSLALI